LSSSSFPDFNHNFSKRLSVLIFASRFSFHQLFKIIFPISSSEKKSDGSLFIFKISLEISGIISQNIPFTLDIDQFAIKGIVFMYKIDNSEIVSFS